MTVDDAEVEVTAADGDEAAGQEGYGSLRYDAAPKRRAIIRELVEDSGFCSAAELSARLGVSEMTIRRDIARLATAGLIRSVHGGATVVVKEAVSHITERASRQQASKRAIGRKAVEFVDPNFVVAFDSGTTTLEVARAIPLETPMSVVTNSLPIIDELGHRDGVHLIGIGGVYDPDLEAFSVTAEDPILRELRVDVLFLAARHITAGGHYTDTHGPAETKRALISIADHVVLVVDSSKFAPSPKAMVRVSGLDVCETIITDDHGADSVERALVNYRGEIIRVPVDEPVGRGIAVTNDGGLDGISLRTKVPVIARCDVLVVGGGPSGIAASVAAARNGARTMLVERHGFLGGNNTGAGIGPYMPAFSNDGETQIVRGIFDELVRRMEAAGGAIHPSKVAGATASTGFWRKPLYVPGSGTDPGVWAAHTHDGSTPFDTEILKREAERMCLEADVDLLLESLLVDSLLDGSRCGGGIFADKAGLRAIQSAITIDCTGDADVAFRAGAPTVVGRESDGRTMPATLFFRVTNIDAGSMEEYARTHAHEALPFEDLVEQARANGDFDVVKDMVDIYLEPNGLFWRVNMTKLSGVDGTDPRDLTRAAVEGRRQVERLMQFFRSYVPGMEKAVLVDTAPSVYVRESRRIRGEYVLTDEDVDAGRVFEDAVACGSWPIDIAKGADIGGIFVDKAARRPTSNYYTIPYRSLVPLEVDGLLVSGRCISATHEAAASVRTEPPCFAMGQAAGTAAALAAVAGTLPRAVDGRLLRRTLDDQGAFVALDA